MTTAAHGAAALDAAALLIGVMSGTSADGVSAALARFATAPDGRLTVSVLAHVTRPYTPAERDRLLAAAEGATPVEYARLDFDVGGWFADAACTVLERAGLAGTAVRAIASHGHTIWHDPPRATWQLGQSAVLAERTGCDVVSDFRVRDVAAGGQGAPLVAAADALLFAAPLAWRALQNLGGIGNVTVVPPGGACAAPDAASPPVRAFDTGPGCAVIDGVVRALDPTRPYDVDGAMARRGRARGAVVAAMLAHPFFAASPPRSTGRELFSRAYIAEFVARCRADGAEVTDADIVATAVALTAGSIADAYRRFVPESLGDVVLSGGGARNPALVAALTAALAPVPVVSFDELFFDGDAKEAVAFALLGYLFLQHRPGSIPAATGARGPRVLGKLTPA